MRILFHVITLQQIRVQVIPFEMFSIFRYRATAFDVFLMGLLTMDDDDDDDDDYDDDDADFI